MISYWQQLDAALQKAKQIKVVYTDCDGVLTDNGVYYSAEGETLKRFSFRDGMGMERLQKLAKIASGIITRENSKIVAKRAEKLQLEHCHIGVQNKALLLQQEMKKCGWQSNQIAYIGDDANDLEIIQIAGLTACPADAVYFLPEKVDYVCKTSGGHGAFREFAEFIMYAQSANKTITN